MTSQSSGRGAAVTSRQQWVPAIAAVGLGAALVLGSGMLVWFRVLGVDLTGFRMARLITDYSGVVDAVPPAFLGVLWYLLPLAGVLAWLRLFIQAPVAVHRSHLVLGLMLVPTIVVYLIVAADRSEITNGPLVALAGALMIVAGSWAGLRGQAGAD